MSEAEETDESPGGQLMAKGKSSNSKMVSRIQKMSSKEPLPNKQKNDKGKNRYKHLQEQCSNFTSLDSIQNAKHISSAE